MKRYTVKYWKNGRWVKYHTDGSPWSNENVRLSGFATVRLNSPITSAEMHAAIKKIFANDPC